MRVCKKQIPAMKASNYEMGLIQTVLCLGLTVLATSARAYLVGMPPSFDDYVRLGQTIVIAQCLPNDEDPVYRSPLAPTCCRKMRVIGVIKGDFEKDQNILVVVDANWGGRPLDAGHVYMIYSDRTPDKQGLLFATSPVPGFVEISLWRLFDPTKAEQERAVAGFLKELEPLSLREKLARIFELRLADVNMEELQLHREKQGLESLVAGYGQTEKRFNSIVVRPLSAEPDHPHLIDFDSTLAWVSGGRFQGSPDMGGYTIPGIFVHSKTRDRWLQIEQVSTVGAKFGKSLPEWDLTPFASTNFVPLPIPSPGRLHPPSNITFDEMRDAYVLHFNSRYNFSPESARTRLLIPKKDLMEAFDYYSGHKVHAASFNPRGGANGRQPTSSETIHDAARNGNLEQVEALLKDNPDWVFSRDNHDETPLQCAAATGHKDVVEFLLANKADVNARDYSAETPLDFAAFYGDKDVAAVLLASKAEVSAKDISGYTPLHFAARCGHNEVAALLLANMADVDAKDNGGQTPLHLAAMFGNKEIVALLLANKADAKAKSNFGDTPLHRAVSYGHKDIAQLLLANKADVDAKDNRGLTPLHLAAIYRNKDMAEFLRQHGGRE
jgi:ankyrin repeat protein